MPRIRFGWVAARRVSLIVVFIQPLLINNYRLSISLCVASHMTSFAIKPSPDMLLYGLTDERVISALGAMTHEAGM